MTSNNMELLPPKLDENYMQNFQSYLKHNTICETVIVGNSTPSTQAKVTKEPYKAEECKICSVLQKPGDLPQILNQGLYYKYTSSQDFFYTKDITYLLEKRRQPFCIRYYDDLIYDEEKEHLKAVFNKTELKSLMGEIREFYSQFHIFPRVFTKPFIKIINSNIAKHRRLEYIKVFQENSLNEEKTNKEANLNTEHHFNFMQMLGETFLRENYKDVSVADSEKAIEKRPSIRRETEQYFKEMEANFYNLKMFQNQKGEIDVYKLSNAMYNRHYMLYSRNDSETAEELLKTMLQEFKIAEMNAIEREKEAERLKEKQKKPKHEENKIKTARFEGEAKIVRERKKTISRSRPQSPSSNNNVKKFESEQNSCSKDGIKYTMGNRHELGVMTERGVGKDLRSAREAWVDECEPRLLKVESTANLHHSSNKSHYGDFRKKEIRGTDLVAKLMSDNLREALMLERENILNQVSQLRTSQNKISNFKSEERKNNTPIETQYKPYEDGSSTATSKQIKMSYINSPSGFKSHSSLETLVLKKHEERSSKKPVIRPDVVLPNTSREPKAVLKRADSITGFDSIKSNRSKDGNSKTGSDSSTLKSVLKGTKSGIKLIGRLIEKESPQALAENRRNGEIINLKKSSDGSCHEGLYLSKRVSLEDTPDLIQKVVQQPKFKRSASSGIKKLRFEVSPRLRKDSSRTKNNSSGQGNHQNFSDLYQGISPMDQSQKSRVKDVDYRNYDSVRIAEIYSSQPTVRKRKTKSNVNIIVHPSSMTKSDIMGKDSESKNLKIDLEVFKNKDRDKSKSREMKHLIDIWSPKITKQLLAKDKGSIKPQTTKGSKHQRYASRG